MRITTITYGYTKNLGNSQSERLEMTAELSDREQYLSSFCRLREEVRKLLDGGYDQEIEDPDFHEFDM